MINDLKKRGFKVFVRHSRPYTDDPEVQDALSLLDLRTDELPLLTRREAEKKGYSTKNVFPYGGKTEIEIYKNGNLVGREIATCSISDHFCRRMGTRIAAGRLIKKLGI